MIVGTGAVATFLGEKLSANLDSLQFFGSPSERLTSLSKRFGGSGVSCPDGVEKHDLWIVALKTWQNREKAELLRKAPKPQAILVIENGLHPEDDWRVFPGVKLERGLATFGVKRTGPGMVVGGEKGELVLEFDSRFREILSSSSLVVRIARDMRRELWHKLSVNASLNVLAALGGLKNGEILRDPEACTSMRKAAEEVKDIALAEGVDWGTVSPGELVERVARNTADNICSTLSDLRSGRPTEYSSINGELLKLAFNTDTKVSELRRLDKAFRALWLPSIAIGVKAKRASSPLPQVRVALSCLNTGLSEWKLSNSIAEDSC